MIFVLDANAIISMLNNEPGGADVAAIIDDLENTCCIHAVNLCEIYYGIRREKGETYAQNRISLIKDAGIRVHEDMDERFWQEAGRIKADFRRISLADCFCAVLARRLGGEVVTTDHEFDPLAASGVWKVRFIR